MAIVIAIVFLLWYLYDSGTLNALVSDVSFGNDGDGDNFEDAIMPNQFSGSLITNDESTWPRGDQAWNVARAIAHAEGYNIAMSNPYRLNNPGDLSDGAKTYGSEPHSGSSVTRFPDAATGWQWLHDKIVRIVNGGSSVYNPDMSWLEIGTHWAPPNAVVWASNVAAYLGVDASSRMGEYFGI